MPFPPIAITGKEQLLGFNVANNLEMPSDGTPLVVAFDVPPWHWTPFSWSPPRRTISVSTVAQTNSGVYGPNPPEINGLYGKVSGPAIGVYGNNYNMARVLYPGRYYLVVRTNALTNTPSPVVVEIV